MRKSVLLLSFWMLWAGTTWSQIYSGPNTAKFSSTGSEVTTTYETPALVGRYVAEDQKLILMAKTGAIPLAASQQDQAMYQAIFMPSSNRLLRITIDLSTIAFTSDPQTLSLPAEIVWNDLSYTENIELTFTLGQEAISYDLEATLPLQEFSLQVPAEYSGRFSNQMFIRVLNASLPRR